MLHTAKMSSIPTRIPQQHGQHSIARPTQHNGQPSKLQMMHLQMQERHLREKEEKLLQYRNQNQNNSYRRAESQGPAYDESESGTVRKFFQERRELSDQNGYVSNINHHYKKVKQGTYNYQAQGHPQQAHVRSYGGIHKQREMGYGGHLPIPKKNSAGRDKAHPLAPIERTPKQTPHGSRQSSRRSSAQSSNSKVNSFGAKTKFARPHVGDTVPYESEAEHFNNTEDNGISSSRSNSLKKKSTSFKEWQEKQKRIRQMSVDHGNELNGVQNGAGGTENGPLTDFEKWQMEQDANKQIRLPKFREQNKNHDNHEEPSLASNRSDYSTKASSPTKLKISQPQNDEKSRQKKMLLNKRINSRKNLFASPGRESLQDEDAEDHEDNEISRKQLELEEMIKRQQVELTRIQHEREAEEEREKKEGQMRKKRAAEQKERQRKEREAHARERRETQAQERKQREIEERVENERLTNMRARESPKMSSRYEYVDSDPEQDLQQRTPDPPFPQKAARASRSRNQKKRPPPLQQPAPVERYQPEPDPSDHATAFYMQAAAEAERGVVDLAPCKVCGRKFARDRLEKHIKVCKDTSKKKRKVFDPVKMRTEGTEAAQHVRHAQSSKSAPPKKSNWRQQHDNFIKTIRYAKAVTDAEKGGGNVADIPPPPVTENPDYKQCPYCERKFSPGTAERHIPRCKDMKSRPAPPRARRK